MPSRRRPRPAGSTGCGAPDARAARPAPTSTAATATGLRHVSYFLSHVTRPRFHEGTVDLVPCNFSEVPHAPARGWSGRSWWRACTPPDRHGYVSLGTNADYVAPFIGKVPFFVEANAADAPHDGPQQHPPVARWRGGARSTGPLVEVPPAVPDAVDQRIADLVVERIPDGACVQAGIGSIPNGVLAALGGHRDLGIHTELLSDGVIDLVEHGVVTGVHKVRRPGKVVTTFALGTRRLYDFLDGNPAVELLPVDWVNDPRVIAQERGFVSINATLQIDFLGQAASETHRRPVLVGERRPGRLRPRRHVLRRRPGLPRAPVDGRRRAPCRGSSHGCPRARRSPPSRTPSTRWSPSTAWPSSAAAASASAPTPSSPSPTRSFRDDLEASARTLGWW